MITLILFFLVFIEFIFYFNFNKLFSISRYFDSGDLFHLSSFLMGNRSTLWTNHFQVTNIPSHEHQIFLGIGFFTIITTFYLLKLNIQSKIIKLLILATFTNIILFFSFGKLSPYKLIQFSPPFNTMRLQVRSIVILIFPISIILGYFIDRIYSRKKINSLLIVCLAIFLIYFESATAKKTMTNIEEIYSREKSIFSKIDNEIEDKKIFVYKKNTDIIDITDLDVMMYAQKKNLYTLNIFTTFLPQNYEPLTTCKNVMNYIDTSKKILLEKGYFNRANFGKSEIAFINFNEDCNE